MKLPLWSPLALVSETCSSFYMSAIHTVKSCHVDLKWSVGGVRTSKVLYLCVQKGLCHLLFTPHKQKLTSENMTGFI